eukprot:3883331-Rhodomonas_salina.5
MSGTDRACTATSQIAELKEAVEGDAKSTPLPAYAMPTRCPVLISVALLPASPLPSYAIAMGCPVLNLVLNTSRRPELALSERGWHNSPQRHAGSVVLVFAHNCVSGTDSLKEYAATSICLRCRYAMSGTDLGYAATRLRRTSRAPLPSTIWIR